jgi:ABC-type bacteriocin/lantibiotic exporter with double-glycine peptidase domain
LREVGNLEFLLKLIAPFRSRLTSSVVLMLLAGLLASADPLLIRHLIDRDLPQHHLTASLLIGVAMGACLLGSSLAVLFGGAVNFSIEQATAQSLRLAIMEQLNRLSVRFHETTPTGENITRMGSDVDQISQLASDFISSTMRACAFLVFNIAVMFYMNKLMTLAMVPALVLFAILQRRFGALLRNRAEHAQKEVGRASSIVTEYLSALPQIQLLCAEKLALRNASAVWTNMVEARKRQKSVELLYSGTINGAFVLATLMVLSFGSYQFSRGALTIGALVAFYAYQIRLFQPVSVATDLFSRFQRAGASIRRVRAILDSDEAPEDYGTITALPVIKKGIVIDRVGYSYDGLSPALRDISLAIRAGQSVAIVGPSGSGKSTLGRMLVRLAEPQVGKVTLDGNLLAQYSLSALRQAVCYVPQRPVLFDGSIRDNLLFANPEATDQELASAIEIAQFRPVVEKLHHGLGTSFWAFWPAIIRRRTATTGSCSCANQKGSDLDPRREYLRA